MNWAAVRFPGAGRLRRRVAASCARASSEFGGYGSRFGDWVERGAEARPATVDLIEPRVVAYLDQAAALGRRWGLLLGTAFGLGIGVPLVLVALLWTVTR
jgi:hypothetical protein